MRNWAVMVVLVIGGVLAWKIGESLSSDAISMGLGIVCGVFAGIPAALMVMAASRRREYVDGDRRSDGYGRGQNGAYGGYGPYGQQPPVIVVTAAGALPQPGQHPGALQPAALDGNQWPAMRQNRQYKVVGEREEMVDEW